MEVAVILIGKSQLLKEAWQGMAAGVEKAGETAFSIKELDNIQAAELVFIGITLSKLVFSDELKKLAKKLGERQNIAVFTATTAAQAKPYFEKQCRKIFKKQNLIDTLFIKAKLEVKDGKIVKTLNELELKRLEGFGERMGRRILNSNSPSNQAKWKIKNYKKG